MSKFYSSIQGCAGEATRRGTERSGIRASVQSYSGSVISELNEVNGEIILSIDTSSDSRSSWGNRQFRGTISEFNEMCQLMKDIKEGKVSITKHRAKSNKQLGLERAFK